MWIAVVSVFLLLRHLRRETAAPLSNPQQEPRFSQHSEVKSGNAYAQDRLPPRVHVSSDDLLPNNPLQPQSTPVTEVTSAAPHSTPKQEHRTSALVTSTMSQYDREPVQYVDSEETVLATYTTQQLHRDVLSSALTATEKVPVFVTSTTQQYDSEPIKFALSAAEQEEIVHDVCSIAQLIDRQFGTYKHRVVFAATEQETIKDRLGDMQDALLYYNAEKDFKDHPENWFCAEDRCDGSCGLRHGDWRDDLAESCEREEGEEEEEDALTEEPPPTTAGYPREREVT